MIRRIIQIDKEKCNGCGACANACHEGAIDIMNGKAELVREHFCDGLGDCLPTCPTGAITFVEREAAAYDEQAVRENRRQKHDDSPCGCPGHQAQRIEHAAATGYAAPAVSELRQWPCQIRLVPVNAPYFDEAELLVAADCTAYACAGLHSELMRGRVTLIGCPKLDGMDYSEKLTEILRGSRVRSVTVARMEVPCCGGLELAVKNAVQASGKALPLRVVTVTIDGRLRED